MADNENIANKNSEATKPTVSAFDEDLDAPYTDERSVTISCVLNYSAYRKANMKVLGQKREVIGSSITSSRILSSNAEEVAAYFPALLGISANNENFVARVKAWLNNIHFEVRDKDVVLDTSFRYKHKKDYLNVKKQEDEICAEYEKVDRANQDALRKALKLKIDRLNALESTKYKYGDPVNLEEYLMYRHCLLYKEVAKDTAFINSDSSIRFYIKDEAREAELRKKLIIERKTAMTNYVELSGTKEKFDAVYLAICQKKNDNMTEALGRDNSERQQVIMDYVNTNPDKFNKLYNDKKIILKAFIENLILRGELVRTDYNQQITKPDGTFIGANINDAIAWFENPINKGERTVFENKLKH
jgi:hypothetical protein